MRAFLGILPALTIGVAVMVMHGSPLAMPAVNMGSAAAGLLLVLILRHPVTTLVSKRPASVALALLALEALTLTTQGTEGVHRWISCRGVRLHVAAMGAPLLLLALVVLWNHRRTWPMLSLAAAGLCVNVLQPDAGQATALAAGVVALAALPATPRVERLIGLTVAVAGALLAWTRPDPLAPADLVENVVQRAFELHAVMGALAVAALLWLPASAVWPLRQGTCSQYPARIALAAYLLASIGVVALGEFPTPVLGFGASPIIGAVIGLGLLERPLTLCRSSAREPGPNLEATRESWFR